MSIPASILATACEGPLTIKDIEGFETEPNITDPVLLEQIKNRNKDLARYRVGYVNKHYKEWQKIWPDGRPIEFYKALQACQEDFETVIKKESFRHAIRREVEAVVGAGAPSLRVSLTHESARQSPAINISPEMRAIDIMSWSQAFRKKVIQLILDEYSPSEIQTKTAIPVEQLDFVKGELNKLGFLKRKGKRKKEEKQCGLITGFTFIKNGKKFRAGKLLIPTYDPDMNPFKGLYDAMSVPFKKPMMCPVGYVLDYDSWYKLYENSHLHPYTNEKLGSLRCLIPIDTNNIEQYRSFIKNFPKAV